MIAAIAAQVFVVVLIVIALVFIALAVLGIEDKRRERRAAYWATYIDGLRAPANVDHAGRHRSEP